MRKHLLFLICVLVYFPTVAQQDVDGVLEQADHLILNSAFQDALALLNQASARSSSIQVDNKKAEALTRLGLFEDARKQLAEIETRLVRQPNDFLGGITSTNVGFLQLNQGRSDLAEESLQSALKNFESAKKTNSPEVAQALSYLGLVYISQGKYSQAQEQLHRALALRQNLQKNKDALVAATYNDLGLAYSQTDKDMALDFYEAAHKMYLKLYGDSDQKIAISSINTGIIYRDLELFGDAIDNFETALKIWNNVYRQPNPAKAIALYNLGQTYLLLNDKKSAMEYYRQSLKMYEESYGPTHPEMASVLNAIGNLYLSDSNFGESLKAYQQALRANVLNFKSDDPTLNPPLKDYYNGTRLLHTLLFKAQAFEARYTRKSLKFSDLQKSLEILTTCDSLIDQLRQHSTNENDKMMLGVMANEVYADGVRVAHLAGLNAVKKQLFFEKAFYFAEKSKSAVLLESISDANAKSFARIPQSLLEEEKNLKSTIAVTSQKLALKPGPDEEKNLREILFAVKRQYADFVQRLEREYPEYFNLKFNPQSPAIPQLQKLLADTSALISYFIDDKNSQLYIFLVRKGSFRVWHRPLPAEFDRYITGLRNGLFFREINTYKKSAFNLAATLLPPIPSSVTDLLILPAGRLAVIPFETLLTRDAGSITAYNALPYLVRDYNIRYEFSAGLLHQKAQHQPPAPPRSILLCAPVNFPQRPALVELPGTEKEVGDIAKLFTEKNLTASAYTHIDANEKLIKSSSLKDFGFLHFATHGVVDEVDPELSRIFFRSSTQDDGDLFSGEIYNLDLNADLVTLSACQTGLGKVLKGEGVVGLSRALVYAGARKIVVSYWNVADESTALLMKDFYYHILRNPTGQYSHALRQAKLRSLAADKFCAPYYWAPFVLIGY